ncbi:MAG: hypothetical protein AB8B82_03390 [Roseovarius sp.]
MQFLESSVLGLRAACHVLTSPTIATPVTLYPMVHVGEARFYDALYQAALAHDVVLYEGVHSPIVTRLTRSYRWLGLSRLGLVVQPKLALTGGQARRVLADVPPAQFQADWAKVPFAMRALLNVASPLYGVIRGLTLTRAQLAKGLNQNDLTSRADTLAWDRHTKHYLELIQTTRDAHLTACLKAELTQSTAPPGPPASIGVIYGAAHMPAVTRFLAEFAQYRVAESAWHTVFET